MNRRRSQLLAAAALIAACEAPKPIPPDSQARTPAPSSRVAAAFDTVPVPASADVGEYFELKRKYGKAGALQTGWRHPTTELNDLQARLQAIIGPVIIDGRPVPTRITLAGTQYDGQDSGQELDGLTFQLAQMEAIVSTRALVAGWLASHPVDSAASPLDALEADDALTWVFSGTAAARQYANIRKHERLPDDVFIAKLVLFAQDIGDWPPDQLIVGVARGERIYLVSTQARWVLRSPAECLPFNEKTYYDCYDRIAAGKPEYQQLVAQVREIAALFPEK